MVKRRSGFTLIELLVVVAIIALLISILLPSLSRARELAKRAVCSANLRGIGQGMHIYANDNEEWFPHSAYNEGGGPAAPNGHGIYYVNWLSRTYTEQRTILSTNASSVHPSRSLFLLVIGGTTTPKQFICTSAQDVEDPLRNKLGATETAAQAGINRFDFRGYNMLSYGYQLPFGRVGKPREGMDPRQPLGADKGPYFDASATDQNDGRTEDIDRTNSPPPGFTDNATTMLKYATDRWRSYNSRNHNSEGQEVLFVDSHVEFFKRPICGINFDNIYTMMGTPPSTPDYTLETSLKGCKPISQRGSLVQTDTVIVP